MNPQDDERLPGEDELAALYRKLPDKQPGPALDAAVLRAAAEAIQPAAARLRRSRWPVALGTAATLVLAFGLTWHMREWPSATRPALQSTPAERSESIPAASMTAAATAPAPTPAAVALPPPAAPMPPAVIAPHRASRELETQREQDRSMPPGILAKRQRVMSAPPPAAPAPIAETTVAAASPATESVAPQAGFDAARSDQMLAGAIWKPTAPALAAQAPAPFVNQSAAVAARAQSIRSESTNAGMPKQQTAQEQAPVAAAAYDAPAPTMAAPPTEPAAKSSPPDVTAALAGDTAAQELDKIRQLFALDRRDEARQRLAAFHRIHPDYALPPELRSQLSTP
jgi:Meckel syndrome type 1 protein